MILGTGIDIIEVERIRESYGKFGDRFLNRILQPGEIEYCLGHTDPAPHLAARFAAKEAVSKAFGTGIGNQFGWHDAEVGKEKTGKPFVILHAKGKMLMEKKEGKEVQLSLSHTKVHAVAMALLVG